MLKIRNKESDLIQQVTLSGIILLLIAVVQVGIEIFAAPLMTDEILDLEWSNFSCGSPAISFMLPREPKPAMPRIPEELLPYIVNIETYSYKEADNYQMIVNSVEYFLFFEADLKGAARGAINEMKNQKGIFNVKFKEEPYRLGKLSGIQQYGTFEEDETIFEFTAVYFSHKSTMWQVMMTHRRGDAYGRKITEKILKSLRISNA